MAEVNIDSFFPSLESQAARLNAASDRANSILQALEKRLVALNVGLEFWCSQPIEVGDSEGDIDPYKTTSKVIQVFGLARVDGKWCLAVKAIRIVDGFYEGDMSCPYRNEFSDGPATPLLKSSRSLRSSALKFMPDFFSELERHVSSTAVELESTADKLESA